MIATAKKATTEVDGNAKVLSQCKLISVNLVAKMGSYSDSYFVLCRRRRVHIRSS